MVNVGQRLYVPIIIWGLQSHTNAHRHTHTHIYPADIKEVRTSECIQSFMVFSVHLGDKSPYLLFLIKLFITEEPVILLEKGNREYTVGIKEILLHCFESYLSNRF